MSGDANGCVSHVPLTHARDLSKWSVRSVEVSTLVRGVPFSCVACLPFFAADSDLLAVRSHRLPLAGSPLASSSISQVGLPMSLRTESSVVKMIKTPKRIWCEMFGSFEGPFVLVNDHCTLHLA